MIQTRIEFFQILIVILVVNFKNHTIFIWLFIIGLFYRNDFGSGAHNFKISWLSEFFKSCEEIIIWLGKLSVWMKWVFNIVWKFFRKVLLLDLELRLTLFCNFWISIKIVFDFLIEFFNFLLILLIIIKTNRNIWSNWILGFLVQLLKDRIFTIFLHLFQLGP